MAVTSCDVEGAALDVSVIWTWSLIASCTVSRAVARSGVTFDGLVAGVADLEDFGRDNTTSERLMGSDSAVMVRGDDLKCRDWWD